MFRHHEGISPEELDALQLASDQVTEAQRYIDETQQNLALREIHPWHADNNTLWRLGLAANALANDRTAELLRDECVSGEGRKVRMSSDAFTFARDLTRNGRRWMDQGTKGSMSTQEEEEIGLDSICRDLNPENMLPFWPRTTAAGSWEAWQGADTPSVTMGFLRGIVRAGRDLQGHAFNAITTLSDPNRALAPIPPEYDSMWDVIMDIIGNAQVTLDAADGLLAVTHGDLSDAAKHDVYMQVHDGYIGMANAWTGTICPPTLGEEFYPEG